MTDCNALLMLIHCTDLIHKYPPSLRGRRTPCHSKLVRFGRDGIQGRIYTPVLGLHLLQSWSPLGETMCLLGSIMLTLIKVLTPDCQVRSEQEMVT